MHTKLLKIAAVGVMLLTGVVLVAGCSGQAVQPTPEQQEQARAKAAAEVRNNQKLPPQDKERATKIIDGGG